MAEPHDSGKLPRWLDILFGLDRWLVHPVGRVLSFLHLDTAEYLLSHYICWHLECLADRYEQQD